MFSFSIYLCARLYLFPVELKGGDLFNRIVERKKMSEQTAMIITWKVTLFIIGIFIVYF